MTFLKKVFGSSTTSPAKLPPLNHMADATTIPIDPAPHNSSGTNTAVPAFPSPKLPFSTAVDALPSPPPRRPTFNFADFELQRTLGTGSFGRVCLALHRPSGQYFAMKKLRKSDVVRLKQVEHTNNERSLLSQVESPFIVRMVCTFQDERHLYIILEYVSGGELFSLLRKVRVRSHYNLQLQVIHGCPSFLDFAPLCRAVLRSRGHPGHPVSA